MSQRGIETGKLAHDVWYMACGEGPPLVYLPPFGVHNQPLTGWQRRTSLRAVMRLTRHFRVWWINRKEGLSAGATIQDLAGDAANAIQARFFEPVDVVGYSIGGMISLSLAADHPQLIRRLVVGGIAHRLTPYERAACNDFVRYAQAGNSRAAMASLVHGSFRNPVAKAVLGALASLFAPGVRREWNPHDAVVALQAAASADLDPLLPAIAAPTLHIAGERDFNCPPDYVRELVSAVPTARSATVPNKGHNGTMTSHAFARHVTRFLLEGEPEMSTGSVSR